MRIGIDASNLLNGGGRSHLIELLRAANPEKHGFDKIIIWGNKDTLNLLPTQPWLYPVNCPELNGSLAKRFWWQNKVLPSVSPKECDVLFSPGGFVADVKIPSVTMCRNMLPFEHHQWKHFFNRVELLRLITLRRLQLQSFRRASGLIYLTEYSRAIVQKMAKKITGHSTTISHGISDRFRCAPRQQRSIGHYDGKKPFRILYVSTIEAYKHPWNVLEAIVKLRELNYPVTLDLVGSPEKSSLRRLQGCMARLDPKKECASYRGKVAFDSLPKIYQDADLFVFASSCETLPNILLEAMAAGLPIACSNKGPMPEVLGEKGIYFDPQLPTQILQAVAQLIEAPHLREATAQCAFERASKLSWDRCAQETFSFLSKVALEKK